MIDIYFFGASSFVSKYLIPLLKRDHSLQIFTFQRSDSSSTSAPFFSTQFPSQSTVPSDSNPIIIISLLPIWVTSPFLHSYLSSFPSIVPRIQKILICSSSSVVTKKYSFIRAERVLSSLLQRSEESLLLLSSSVQIPIFIIKPSILYDNLASASPGLTSLCAKIAFLRIVVLPSSSGLRQPLHASRLAALFYALVSSSRFHASAEILVGGDTRITFNDMIVSLSESMGSTVHCLYIPASAFHFLVRIFYLFFPERAAFLLRIFVDMASFPTCSSYLHDFPSDHYFPVKSP